ncbi:MAG: glycosyltransferase family 4 protein [Puniceicoccaceae bacterium]
MSNAGDIKVLVVTSVFPRWKDDSTPPFVLNLCRDLMNAGCRITVLAPHSPGSMKEEDWDGMRIVRFSYMWPTSWQSLFYEGGMLVRLRRNPLRGLLIPFLVLSQCLAIRKMLQEGYDILHAHSLLPQGMTAAIAKSRSVPLVTSSHGADVFLLKSKWGALLKWAVKKSHALIANSSATRDRLLDLGADDSKVTHIPATPNYPDPEEPTHAQPPEPHIFFAGRVIEEKGVDLLVEAMPEILKAFPNATLRIAGSGALEDQLFNRAKELNLESAITFLGWQNSNDLRSEMQSATILVAPSRMIEGQNLVVTEALSVGCPVITTPRGGVLDLIKDKDTGVVISGPETTAIADAVIHCLGHPELLAQYSENGYRHFQENYSRKEITARTLKLYDSVVSK